MLIGLVIMPTFVMIMAGNGTPKTLVVRKPKNYDYEKIKNSRLQDKL